MGGRPWGRRWRPHGRRAPTPLRWGAGTGGRFAWNVFAFDHAIAARLDGQRQDEPVPHTLHYAVGDNRVDITLDSDDSISLWWATRNEWLGLIDVAGLELEALYGGFAGEPFGDESREYLFVARKP